MQQDVGHRGADLRAAGNRQEMGLRLGAGDFDEIAVGQARGLRQDRRRHRDIVVSGEPTNDVARRLIDRGKAPAELLERFALYPLDEVAQDVIEHIDLLIVEPIRVGNKKVGDPPQRVDTFVLGAALDRVLKLGDQ
ncbi:MAG TPA: hypothetical protein VK591_12415 [Xanthobacteraceae bacterium]|nr:hypothetical protein [Xanthobacteraceae bacterium]